MAKKIVTYKTAKDYRKELSDLEKRTIALENRIKKRALDLVTRFPDLKIGLIGNTDDWKRIIENYDDERININQVLSVIQIIEEYNEENSNFIQGDLFEEK